MIQLFLTLYLMTIPMLTFMNFTVLTDSLATSMLVLFLASFVRLLGGDGLNIGNYLLMGCSLVAESLLRADRLYSSLVLMLVLFIMLICRSKENRRRLVIVGLCVGLLSTFLVKGIGKVTQTPGVHGRVKTTLEFVLLDRVVWPNMYANYWNFPEEYRYIITSDEAQIFDLHNNNVMYQLAPLVIARVGEDKAREVFRTMAAVVFDKNTKKVIGDIGEDVAAMAFTPISSLLNAKGRCSKADSWNIDCMSTVTPDLTVQYNTYYQYTFLVLASFGLLLTICACLSHRRRNLRSFVKFLIPFAGMSMILTLWFSLGDGAPPNDRYALIIYLFWSLIVVGMIGFWDTSALLCKPNKSGMGGAELLCVGSLVK